MALAVGTPAPDFTLLDTNRKPVTLSSFKGKKVILAFLPGAFTGVCTAEVCRIEKEAEGLNNANATVISVSPDSPFANAAFKQANQLSFPVLSDHTRETSRAYDVELKNFADMEGYTSSHRATFIIDKDGIIRHVDVTANPGVEPEYDKVFAAIEGI